MSKRPANPSIDKLAMFRDPPDRDTTVDEEFVVMADDDSPVLSPEREKELREQLTDGLAHLPRICGALTRRGTLCECKKLYKNGRCKFHGGLSTGPKTPEGKARAAANLEKARWWAARIRALRARDKRRDEPDLGNAPSSPAPEPLDQE
jgi:hypothetical protein